MVFDSIAMVFDSDDMVFDAAITKIFDSVDMVFVAAIAKRFDLLIERSCVLASTRAAPTSRCHRRAKVQTKTICISHMEKWDGWKPEDERR
jgi:hypothetical protein